MIHKYVRHSTLGFVLWPTQDEVFHAHIGLMIEGLVKKNPGEIISAGFVRFEECSLECYGFSNSLMCGVRPDDSKALAAQLSGKEIHHGIPQT